VAFEGGKELIKTSLPAGAKHRGLLGHGSILALTSNGVETSPVTLGHWVLAKLLGTPPPKEVPAIVPDLNSALTVRDLLEKRRSDPGCID
jgi:hypothetical protein